MVAHFGTIDILVNNAGAAWGAPAEDYPPEAWHKVMNLNVNAMFFLSQYVGKHVMIPKKSGKIINISSVAGLAGNPPGMATIAYNTSKGADINFTRALAFLSRTDLIVRNPSCQYLAAHCLIKQGKYAEALELKVLDENGKQQVVTMGSYGIGVSRAVAAIAEQSFDELGLCWPRK